MTGYRANLVSGVIERDNDGRIIAKLEWSAPHQEIAEFAKRKGLSEMSHVCLADEISRDPANPTVFDYVLKIRTEEGEELFDHLSWNTKEMGVSVSNELTGQATGFLNGAVIRGSFGTMQRMSAIEANQKILTIHSRGIFEICLED